MGSIGSREEVLEASLAWMDTLWDDDAGLLWTVRRDAHMTRDTAWYALGLLERGDAPRAARALDAVCDQQYNRPGTDYHGTWRRAPQEPDPPDDPVMWIHYDPNWRQFIGTTFAVILDRYDVGDALAARMRTAIDRAVEGEPADRVSPHYANIALMKAWLDAWAGRTGEADTFARRVFDAFDANGAFLEYNSPTYYGIDLWALALWRTSTEMMRTLGSRMETALWRDVARFYHAGLRNMCGPYDRSYGMDMTTHATPLGLWIWSVAGAGRAPFPDPHTRFKHAHDFSFGPCVAMFDAGVPPDVLSELTAFSGERAIEQVVTTHPQRTATAWLADDVMFGGWSGPASGIGIFQHRHATIHWRRHDGGTGWAHLRPDVRADVTVEQGVMRITVNDPTPIVFEAAPALEVRTDRWTSDGLSLDVHAEGATTVLRHR